MKRGTPEGREGVVSGVNCESRARDREQSDEKAENECGCAVVPKGDAGHNKRENARRAEKKIVERSQL